jgi:hypothetical protein
VLYIPLPNGSKVTISIGSSENTYLVPKDLLSQKSQYFSVMFDESFLESQTHCVTLPLIEEVTSVQSFETLLWWLRCGTFRFLHPSPTQQISAMVELTRFADMCLVTDVELLIADEIKRTLLSSISMVKIRGNNTTYLTSEHISPVALLPAKHSVRQVIAAAVLEGVLTSFMLNFKFAEETCTTSNFRADLHQQLETALGNVRVYFDRRDRFRHTCLDPISGRSVSLKSVGFLFKAVEKGNFAFQELYRH